MTHKGRSDCLWRGDPNVSGVEQGGQQVIPICIVSFNLGTTGEAG